MITGTEFDLEAYLEEERGRVDEALHRALTRLADLFPDELEPAARHAVLTGGKRIRPILCVSAYRACAARSREAGEDESAVYDLGCALELLHAYSLMHDDLPCMDDADLRRGKPTPHKLFGEPTSMRAGAALIPAAALQAWWACNVLGCEPATGSAVLGELMRAAGAGGMVGGQVLDLVGEGAHLNAVQLDGLHRRKTGALLRAALRVGGLAAHADSRAMEALGLYGRAIGLAFQIADDVLDATASADTLGKNPSDADLEKSTYVALYGLEEARQRARAQSEAGRDALSEAGLESPALDALARYVVERRR